MRLSIFIFILFVTPLSIFAQKKKHLPPASKRIPDKDGVVALVNIPSGKSKMLNWHSSQLKFRVDDGERYGKTALQVFFNGKKMYPDAPKTPGKYAELRTLSLAKKDNSFIITTDGTAKADSFPVNLTLKDKAMTYQVTAQCRKGRSDTIIIKRH